ncbi:MAG TPA: sensor histidine kinase [Methylophilus sp.]
MIIPRSLKNQLRLWLLLTMLVVLGVSAAISYSRALYHATQAYDKALLRTVLALSDEIIIDRQQMVRIDIPEMASHLLRYNDGDTIYLRITAPDGSHVWGDASLPLPTQPLAGNQYVFFDRVLHGRAIRVLAFALPVSQFSQAPNILVEMAETTMKRDAMVTEMVEEILLPQIFMMILAAIVIEIGIYFALKPMHDLKDALHQRSHRDLSPLDADSALVELRPLVLALNGLLDRLKAGIQQQQQFIADASHQLRTPIAGLQTQAELALRSHPPAALKETLQFMLRSTTRLSHLIQRLLTMAKTDAAITELKLQPVALTPIIHEECARWIGAASDKQLELEVLIETHQDKVMGDALMLSEMLNNLLENAVQYTPEQGMIQIRLWQTGTRLLLQVTDNGLGIPEEQIQLIFERFHRINPNQGNGCGLGLAIVAEIVEQHDASISVSAGMPHPVSHTVGSRFTVKFARHDDLPTHPLPTNPHAD